MTENGQSQSRMARRNQKKKQKKDWKKNLLGKEL